MIVINGDTRNSQVQNKKKDTQQDVKIAALQTAVDSINSQIEAINTSLSALSSSIDDKYSAQTQTLMNALTSQINALSESLSAVITTGQINADYGNFEHLAVTLSATMANVAATVLNVSSVATLVKAKVTTLEAVNGTVSNLVATEATLQRAVIDSLSIVGSFSIRTLSAETATFNGLNSIEIKASQKVDAPKIIADVVTGRTWHTPIGTPDNTELLKITIPNYQGIIQIQTADDELNVSVFNNALVSWTEKEDYLFRIQRTGNATELYLQNIGDTVDYRLLFIGSEDTVVPTSEIVDKTGIRQNVLTFNGVYGAGGGEGGSGSQIIFVDELPSVGEEGIIYLSKTRGAWVWNDNDGELVPLTGTDLQERVQTNTENIGDLSDLTTTADSDLVSAINEVDSDAGNLTNLTTTEKTNLVSAINEVDSNADLNAGAIATINGNDAGLSMRQVAQDVAGNVYIPCGSVLFVNLPSLSSARIGDVYNVEDSFTTTADFVEGAGIVVSAGTNVVAVDSNGAKKWDVLGVSIDTSSFMQKHNPTGTGAFSMGRRANTVVGQASHAEGANTTASGLASHAEGMDTKASGDSSHAEGYLTNALGSDSHAEGSVTTAEGLASHAEGMETVADGQGSHAEGLGTIAKGEFQHVQGKYNVEDTNGIYADIIGNGSDQQDQPDQPTRKNIEATTWTGDKRLKGTVYINCNDDSTGGVNLGDVLQDYKETEQNTGKKWVNGDKVYSKTVIGKNKQITHDTIPFSSSFTEDSLLYWSSQQPGTATYCEYQGTLYMALPAWDTHLSYIYKLDNTSGEYSRLTLPNSYAYNLIMCVFDGKLYLFMSSPILYYFTYDGTSFTQHEFSGLSMNTQSFKALVFKNRLYVGSSRGLLRLSVDKTQWEVIYTNANNDSYSIYDMCIFDNKLFLADGGAATGLFYYDGVSTYWTFLGDSSSEGLSTFQYRDWEYTSYFCVLDNVLYAIKFIRARWDYSQYRYTDVFSYTAGASAIVRISFTDSQSTDYPCCIYSFKGAIYIGTGSTARDVGGLYRFVPASEVGISQRVSSSQNADNIGLFEYNNELYYDYHSHFGKVQDTLFKSADGSIFTQVSMPANYPTMYTSPLMPILYTRRIDYPSAVYSHYMRETHDMLMLLISGRPDVGGGGWYKTMTDYITYTPNNHINTIPDFKHLIKCDRVVDDKPSEIEVSIDPTTGNVDVGNPVRDYEHLDGVQLLLEYTKNE